MTIDPRRFGGSLMPPPTGPVPGYGYGYPVLTLADLPQRTVAPAPFTPGAQQSQPPMGRVPGFLSRNSDALLAAGLGGLAGNTPRAQLAGMAGGFFGQRSQDKQRASMTEWLQHNHPELVGAYQAGVITPEQIGGSIMEGRKAQRPMTSIGKLQADLEAGRISRAQYDQAAAGIGKPGVEINMPQVGTIPQGYELHQDPRNGAYSMRPIPGGPEDTSEQDALRLRNQGEQTVNLMDTIEQIRKLANESAVPVFGTQSIPLRIYSETPQAKVAAHMRHITSGVALGAMMRLKEASATGATGFGQMNLRELELLINDIGALNLNASEDVILPTLDRVEARAKSVARQIMETVPPEQIQAWGLEPLIAIGGGASNGGSASTLDLPPQRVTSEEWRNMTPEERSLWRNMTPEERSLWRDMTPEERSLWRN